MTKWMLAASAAALAIVSPALAQKGGHGGGNDKGGGGAAKAEHGGGNGGDRAMKADRGNDGGGQVMKIGRDKGNGGGGHEMRVERQADNRFVARDDRGKGNKQARVDRGDGGGKRDFKIGGDERRDNRTERLIARNADRDVLRVAQNDRGGDDDGRFIPRWNDNGLVRGFSDGCPPGLAKKNNGCLPPGQARKLVGTRLPASIFGQSFDGPYRNWYRDDANYLYRNDDDYIYRVRRDGGLIDALFPYQDRDYYYYPVGSNYPADYNFYNVPNQYQSYYPDGGDYSYRYGDGAIYQVNRSNGLIDGIAALLAGDLSVGQPLPQSYGAYNVPLNYRDRYYDTPQDIYRYNDGYIYRADPTTQLITAVISAIV